MFIQHKNLPFTVYGSYQNTTTNYYDAADKSINFYGNLATNLNTPYNFITNPDPYGCFYPNYIGRAITNNDTVVIKVIAITSGTNLEPYKVYFFRVSTLKKGYLYPTLQNAMAGTNKIDFGSFNTVQLGFITKTYNHKVVRFFADAVQCCPEPPTLNMEANYLPHSCVISFGGRDVECILSYDNSTFPGSFVYGGSYMEPNNGYPYQVLVRANIVATFYPQNTTRMSCSINGGPNNGVYSSSIYDSASFPLIGTALSSTNQTISYEFKEKSYFPDSLHLFMPEAKFYASTGPTIDLGTIDVSLSYNASFAGYVSGPLPSNYYNIPGRITIFGGYYHPPADSGYKFILGTLTNQVDNNGQLYVDSGNLSAGQFLSVSYSESQSILHPQPYANLNPPDPFFKSDSFSIRSNNINSYYSTIR